MQLLVYISAGIDRFLQILARTCGWLFLVAIVIICFDVFSRKIGYQLPYFTSTKLQELEWHVTSTLFLGWIGYGIVRNTHVRIDVFTGHLEQRKRDWIDFICTIIFALPYVLIILPYCTGYFWTSMLQLEASDAPNGLPARYIIKGILMFGVFCIFLGVISLLLRKFVDLFGPPELHSANTEMEAVEI